MNEEIWKDIKGYEGLYQVSNLGRVRSLDKVDSKGRDIKGKILKVLLKKNGYKGIKLSKDGKVINHLVHRLVAQVFLPNPNNLPQVNHIDEDKTNNRVDNLEWCDREYNCNYGTRKERIAKNNSRCVIQFTIYGELVKKWDSMEEASRSTNINKGHIWDCCQGRYKTAGGSKWEYYDTDRYLIALMDKTIKDREKKRVA